MSVDELDPFVAPLPSHQLGTAPVRSGVVLRGLVLDVAIADWAGGPVLEVTVSDASGEVCLAFLGRSHVAGVGLGRVLTAAGTVGCRHGRPVVLNPRVWLHERSEEIGDG